jgi:hypothetical protein
VSISSLHEEKAPIVNAAKRMQKSLKMRIFSLIYLSKKRMQSYIKYFTLLQYFTTQKHCTEEYFAVGRKESTQV